MSRNNTRNYNAVYYKPNTEQKYNLVVHVYRLVPFILQLNLINDIRLFKIGENDLKLESDANTENIESIKTILIEKKEFLEKLKNIDELDRNILYLESYFNDYIFNSYVSNLVKNTTSKTQNLISYYKSVLYGNSNEKSIDEKSIYGEFTKYYKAYHTKKEHTNTEKEIFLEMLENLEKSCVERLNLYGSSLVIPFTVYKAYLENNSVDFENGQNKTHEQ